MPSKNRLAETTEWRKFLDFCNEHASAPWWFRGISNAKYNLIPKVGRRQEGKDWYGPVRRGGATLADREFRIFEAFRRRARLDLQFLPGTEFEWLALAQHHGTPTRLLDWTPNPLMAAWFATGQMSHEEGRVARIYAVRVKSELLVDAEGVEPFKKSKKPPQFIISPHWHPRVRAQRGCFSIHPVPNQPWTLENVQSGFFDIKQEHWRAFRRRLFYFGVDASTVMADLAGLGEALSWQYENLVGVGGVGY
jgi:hypothetical protein